MPDQAVGPANPNSGAPATGTVLDEAGKAAAAAGGDKSILDEAGKEAQAAQEAEEKRILEADETTLNDADKGKKAEIVKRNEDKKLLETPDDQLDQAGKDKKAALVKAKDEATKANAVPADGKYTFKVPEGMTLDEGFVAEISPVLKELNITQAGAQKLADVYAKKLAALDDAAAANFKANVEAWRKETYEALGNEAKERLTFVAKVRDRLLSVETREILNSAGIANCKSLILDLEKIGRLISEDSIPPASPVSPDSKDAASVLYPDGVK